VGGEGRKVPKKLFYGYVVTAAGFSIWMIGGGSYSPCFSLFFKPLLAEFGWSRAETSLAFSLSYITQAICSILMGWLSDRVGPRLVVSVLGSFLGISYLLMSQITALWQFQLNYALVAGIALSTFTPPVMAAVSRWFVRRRGLMIGIVQGGLGIGGFVFPPFAGWLIVSFGWRSAYIIMGLIVLIGVVVSGLFLRRDPREMGQLPDGEEGTAPPVVQPKNPGFKKEGRSFQEVIHTSQFWLIAGIHWSFGFCRSTFIGHLAVHVQDLGFSLADGANVLAVVAGSSMIGRIGMGRMADLMGNRATFMISFGATTIALIWGLIAADMWKLYLFAFVFGFAWGAQAVLRFSITSEAFGLVSLGLLMGVFMVAESAAAAFGLYFAGYLFDISGSYQAAFWMGIGFSALGVLMAWRLKPLRREAGNSKPDGA
jgi:MFS family permease